MDKKTIEGLMDEKQTTISLRKDECEFAKGFARSRGMTVGELMLKLLWELKCKHSRKELLQIFEDSKLTEMEIGMYMELKRAEGVYA